MRFMRIKLPTVMPIRKVRGTTQSRKKLGGRPRRKDNPKRVSLFLSARSSQLLDRLSMNHASRGRFIETLLEAAAAVTGAGR
jgi:hypothetical protein